MKIATWNINGIRARIDSATRWLKDANPDVVCFQELKTTDDGFPGLAFAELGYNVATLGQKSFNGVAILSKLRFDEVERGFDGKGDDQARFIAARLSVPRGSIRVASIYLPNGNPVGSDKFSYKLDWLERLEAWTISAMAAEEPLILAGDYNIIPEPEDAKNPNDWTNDALFQPESRGAYRRLINLGFTDAVRACHVGPGYYTFWDYQAGAWQKNNGIRIDHILLSPQAADRLVSATIDKRPRGWEKPADHVPVVIEMDF
jgi:exodeoxyribonuclease-3